jgi:MFS-type transporter involved in bile tolerance (Atg22 family)
MRAARQQHGELDFVGLNRLHVPVALLSMVLVFAAMLRFSRGRGDALALLAASISIATLANAFVCGALSGPHERYGARMSWIMTFVVIVVALRMFADAKASPAARHTAVTSAP